MPSSAERRFFFGSVCLKTSVTANRPISTGIMSMPANRLRLPKVRRCTAYILSCPTQASSRPSRPEMMQVSTWSLSKHVRMDRPMKVTANRSLGPNWSAAFVSG